MTIDVYWPMTNQPRIVCVCDVTLTNGPDVTGLTAVTLIDVTVANLDPLTWPYCDVTRDNQWPWPCQPPIVTQYLTYCVTLIANQQPMTQPDNVTAHVLLLVAMPNTNQPTWQWPGRLQPMTNQPATSVTRRNDQPVANQWPDIDGVLTIIDQP